MLKNTAATGVVNPISYPKTMRYDRPTVMTSFRPGRIVPLAAIPLLREDALIRGQMAFNFRMAETAELLLNNVAVSVHAYFVPHLAFERYSGMDDFNRSFAQVPEPHDGAGIVPYYLEGNINAAHNEIFKVMGYHAAPDDKVNMTVVESYNAIVNHRYKARTSKLPERGNLQWDLAPCFWRNPRMAHIVPDYDQAKIDGAIEIEFPHPRLALDGLGKRSKGVSTHKNETVYQTGNKDVVYPNSGHPGEADSLIAVRVADDGYPDIWADIPDDFIKLNLSALQKAKDLQAFATLRERYSDIDDEYIVDILMSGLEVPEENLNRPILLDRQTALFGMDQRYASDAANLDKSVARGEASVNLNMRLPKTITGGMIVITAEVVPEQLFERARDYFFLETDPRKMPNALEDTLDEDKVSIVLNNHADVRHGAPDSVFGYAPLNHQWNREHVYIGGKYKRDDPNAPFDEDRQQIWANEQIDPSLKDDWWLATNIHQKVFKDANVDTFEVNAVGDFAIRGITQFGKGLTEDSNDYEKLLDQAIDKQPTPAPEPINPK